LEDAQHELGKYLVPDLKLIPNIKVLKAEINNKHEGISNRLMEAIQTPDFVKLAINKGLASICSKLTSKYLLAKAKTSWRKPRKDETRLWYSTARPLLVDHFFDSVFKVGTDLLKVLSSLKRVSEIDGDIEMETMAEV
jgi:stalled ribosome rescue protein Dom34